MAAKNSAWEIQPNEQLPCSMLWSPNLVHHNTRIALALTAGIALLCAVFMLVARSLKGSETNALRGVAGGSRMAWLDNSRLLLMCIIVMGHVISIPTLHLAERAFYLQPIIVWSSQFHMPGFALISGSLSKASPTADRMGRMIVCLGLPYLISKSIWWMYTEYYNPQTTQAFNPFDTYNAGGVEWYLSCLIQWRLIAVLLAPLRPGLFLTLAFVLGLGSGFWINNLQVLAMQRTLSFFPFFAVGFLMDIGSVERALRHGPLTQNVARVVLLMSLIFAFRHQQLLAFLDLGTLGDFNFDYSAFRVETAGWLWQGRALCGIEFYLSWAHRVVRYAISFGMVGLFLAAVPTERFWFTNMGIYTMYPYLLHAWITELGIQPFFQHHARLYYWVMVPDITQGGWVWLVFGMAAFPITVALASKPVRFIFGPLIEPQWLANLCFKPSSEGDNGKAKHVALPSVPTLWTLRAKKGMPLQV